MVAIAAGFAAGLLSSVGHEADTAARRADEAASNLRAAGSWFAEVSCLCVQATVIGLTRTGRQLGGYASGQLGQASSALLLQLRLLGQAAVSLRKLGPNLSASAGRSVSRKEGRLAAVCARLDSASPQHVLELGYAMVE